jgi:hypothetical protein
VAGSRARQDKLNPPGNIADAPENRIKIELNPPERPGGQKMPVQNLLKISKPAKILHSLPESGKL